MNTQLVVDSSGLQEVNAQNKISFSPVITFFARLFSWIFHPIFIPVYVVYFITRLQPYLFFGLGSNTPGLVIARTALIYTFFPIVVILLLKGLNFIDSIYLRSQRDRIIPYIVSIIWYFWAWYVNRSLPDTPHLVTLFTLGVFIGCISGMLANIYFKISMHTIGMGIMLTFILFTGLNDVFVSGLYLAIAFLITGIVCTSRLILSSHSPFEIYAGLVVGIVAQLIAIPFS